VLTCSWRVPEIHRECSVARSERWAREVEVECGGVAPTDGRSSALERVCAAEEDMKLHTSGRNRKVALFAAASEASRERVAKFTALSDVDLSWATATFTREDIRY